MPSLVDAVRRFRGMLIVCLGDVMLDTYRTGTATRLCTEGPAPIVVESRRQSVPGGAANTAANLSALGADVRLIGIVGDDRAGATLREELTARGIPDRWLARDSRATTLCKERLIADGQYVVRIDTGDTRACSRVTLRQVTANLLAAIDGCDALIVSDYDYGATPDAVLDALREARRQRPFPLVVDSKNLRRFAGMQATVVTPNQHEARALVAANVDAGSDMAIVGQTLIDWLGCQHAAITLARDGVLLVSLDGVRERIPAHPIASPADVGAGDSFAAALTLALAAGARMSDAASIGIDAAGIAVAKPGTAVVEQQELLQRVSLRGIAREARTVAGDAERLAEKLLVDRLSGKTIVFTNGVFDILHAGHVAFLREARALGDVLIVGVNSDAGLRAMAARRQPVNSERDRLALIAALDPVDHAILFDEPTPASLIRLLRPHLHVKGGDYEAASLPEAEAVREVGGQVVIRPLAGEQATDAMLDRLIAIAAGGGLGAIHD